MLLLLRHRRNFSVHGQRSIIPQDDQSIDGVRSVLHGSTLSQYTGIRPDSLRSLYFISQGQSIDVIANFVLQHRETGQVHILSGNPILDTDYFPGLFERFLHSNGPTYLAGTALIGAFYVLIRRIQQRRKKRYIIMAGFIFVLNRN